MKIRKLNSLRSPYNAYLSLLRRMPYCGREYCGTSCNCAFFIDGVPYFLVFEE